jgi:hypothetical protein
MVWSGLRFQDFKVWHQLKELGLGLWSWKCNLLLPLGIDKVCTKIKKNKDKTLKMVACINECGKTTKTKLWKFISIQLCTKFVPFKTRKLH